MARLYINNYDTLLTASVLASDTVITVGTPPADPAGDYYRMQLVQYDSTGAAVKREFVDVTAVSGNDLTVTRAAEGSTALDFDIGDTVQLTETAESFDPPALDGVTFIEYSETTAAGTTALDPVIGTIQTYTMAANTAFTDGLSDGQNITLHLSGGATYTATWPTITWVNGLPTLAANTVLQFWKIGTTLYGTWVGDY